MRPTRTTRLMRDALLLFCTVLILATAFAVGQKVQAAFAAPEKAVVTRAYHVMSVRGQVKAKRQAHRVIRRQRAELRKLQRQVRAAGQYRLLVSNVRAAISYVFGPEARHAETVSGCESGGQLDNAHGWLNAGNGQYLGGFQMGSSERATYANGHYSTVLDQVLAAYRLFMERGWGPWQCRETGGLRW